MCGICGVISKKNIAFDELKRMNNMMISRGPDDSGIVIYNDNFNVGMAHRRLAIIDLSEAGHQPMESSDKNVSVVFNGEIYNFRKLKDELSDYAFKSQCDTEVIIAAYYKWGVSFAMHLDGMFAIALYDRHNKKIILARDRIGKKPLYLYSANNEVIFASVPDSIKACSRAELTINTEILSKYLYQGYINSPHSIFKETRKISPGTMAVIDLSGDEIKIEDKEYWSTLAIYEESRELPELEYEEYKSRLKYTLKNAVGKRLISDVPVGAFLSGGIDSSLICAMAQELLGGGLETFTIGVENSALDEAGDAEKIAKHLGTMHKAIYIDKKMMLQMTDELASAYDEPFADSSQLPSLLVSQKAKENVTVVLTGDGGDEIFGGYGTYLNAIKAQKIDRYIQPISKLWGDRKDVPLINMLPLKVRALLYNTDAKTKTQLYRDTQIKPSMEFISRECRECQKPVLYDESNISAENWGLRKMLLDQRTYLPDDNLCKVDRATMHFSLEARSPLLDTQVIELALGIPFKYKINNGYTKYILKDILYEYVPKEIMERPKSGFEVPVDIWLRTTLKEELISYIDRTFILNQGLFDYEYVKKYIDAFLTGDGEKHGSGYHPSGIVWAFFVFQKWYEQAGIR